MIVVLFTSFFNWTHMYWIRTLISCFGMQEPCGSPFLSRKRFATKFWQLRSDIGKLIQNIRTFFLYSACSHQKNFNLHKKIQSSKSPLVRRDNLGLWKEIIENSQRRVLCITGSNVTYSNVTYTNIQQKSSSWMLE